MLDENLEIGFYLYRKLLYNEGNDFKQRKYSIIIP